MKTKIDDKTEWKRVFRFLTVTTEDGYKVTFGHVWHRRVEWQLTWRSEYHTNPDDLETKYQTNNRGPLTEGIMRRGNKPPPVGRDQRPPPPPSPPCPKCGTTDCSTKARFSISGAGVLSTTSQDIMKSCKFRQQLNALERLNIKKKKKKSSKKSEKNYTGSMGPG